MKQILSLLVALACFSSVAVASESFLPVTKDSKVNEGQPTTTYGDEEFYTVWGGPIINEEKALLYFNGVEELHQAGYVCEYALLRLYVTSVLAAVPANIFKAAAGWDEATVCWDNRPGEDHGIEVKQDLPSSQDVWFEVDVTNIVKSWMNDGSSNNGFYVGTSEDNLTAGGCQFASGEFPDTAFRPRLFVEYYPGGGVEQEAVNDLFLEVSATPGRCADISFSLASSGFGSLKVYDALGSLVGTLLDGTESSGVHTLTWKSTPGLYFVRLETSSRVLTEKLVLIR